MTSFQKGGKPYENRIAEKAIALLFTFSHTLRFEQR
jgi:hypothetical protein